VKANLSTFIAFLTIVSTPGISPMAADYHLYNNFDEVWDLDVIFRDQDAVYLQGIVHNIDEDECEDAPGMAIYLKEGRTVSFSIQGGDFIDTITWEGSGGTGVSWGFGDLPEVAIYSSEPLVQGAQTSER
jgi:hypothetical protein